MSLATRCAACGTVFRVVQDQLRVSSGWVRCGRCGEVFNAIESLVDLEIDRPGDGGPPSVHGARVMEDLARVAGGVAGKGESGASPESQPTHGVGVSGEARGRPDVAPSSSQTDWQGEEPVASAPSELLAPAGPAVAGGAKDGLSPVAPHPVSQAPLEPSSEPGVPWVAAAFVRQADRAARWRHPLIRTLLSLAGVLALVTLGWQVSLTHHDWLAARWPILAPVLGQVCNIGGCRIEPPRRIERWVVDSSGLVRAGAANRYRLTMVLRNRDTLVLRTPAIDLVLTDAVGEVIARRVLGAPDFGVSAAEVDAGGSLSLDSTLEIEGAAVVGYTIELFYP